MNELLKDELRAGWLGMPRAYTVFDFMGAAMGAYFLWDGVNHKSETSWVNVGLGAVMVYIHTQRFFYAPQTREGLNQLLKALEIQETV